MTSQNLVIEQKITTQVTVAAGAIGRATAAIPRNAEVALKGYGYTHFPSTTYRLSTGRHSFPSRTDQEGSVSAPMIYSTPFLCATPSDVSLEITNDDSISHDYIVVFLFLSDRILEINSAGGNIDIDTGAITPSDDYFVEESTHAADDDPTFTPTIPLTSLTIETTTEITIKFNSSANSAITIKINRIYSFTNLNITSIIVNNPSATDVKIFGN